MQPQLDLQIVSRLSHVLRQTNNDILYLNSEIFFFQVPLDIVIFTLKCGKDSKVGVTFWGTQPKVPPFVPVIR